MAANLDLLKPSAPNLGELLHQGRVYWSPLFQRQFDWKTRQVEQCFEDALTLLDKDDSVRFLGAIVLEQGPAPEFDRPQQIWIIDGQQRLTTLYLLFVAIVKALHQSGDTARADILTRSSLLGQVGGVQCEPKLRPTVMDTRQFNTVLRDLGNEEVGYIPNEQGVEAGNMTSQYMKLRRLLKKELDEVEEDDRADWLVGFAQRLQNGVLFVAIHLGTDLDAHEVFDRLNTGSQPLTVSDLLRNDVMRVASSDIAEAKRLFDQHWLPFENRFAGQAHREAFFFPMALTRDSTTSKSDTFHDIRDRLNRLRDNDPPNAPAESIKIAVKDLGEYQDAYCALTGKGQNKNVKQWQTEWTHDEKEVLGHRLGRLNRLNVPAVTLPYLLQLLNATKNGDVEVTNTVGCFDVIESFLVRRAIRGLEPTGLHAIFKSLWSRENQDPHNLESSLTTQTIEFPTDDEFKKYVREGHMYRRKLCRYVLWEHNDAKVLAGDRLGNEVWENGIHADHVIPQSIQDPELLEEWGWTEDDYEELKHTWGNLVPLTGPANMEKGTLEFAECKQLLVDKGDLIFKTTREVFANNDSWTPANVRERADQLADFAVGRWPRLHSN